MTNAKIISSTIAPLAEKEGLNQDATLDLIGKTMDLFFAGPGEKGFREKNGWSFGTFKGEFPTLLGRARSGATVDPDWRPRKTAEETKAEVARMLGLTK